MSSEKTENMVLRTVYLPHAVDLRLRSIAFTRGVSKTDLMRDLVRDALDRLQDETTLADAGRSL